MQGKFPVTCDGRDKDGNPVLTEPVRVQVCVYNAGENSISISVECPHNVGSHRHRCNASHLGRPKVGDGVPCPYVVYLPYAHNKKFIVRGNMVFDKD
jgi:hypothetical protein